MKKTVLIIALLVGVIFLFSTASLFAQYAYFGIKGGITLSTFHGDDSDAADWGASTKQSRMAFVVGPYATIVLAKVFAIQPELLFIMKGAKYEYTDIGYTDLTTIKLDYVELPFLFKFYLPMAGPVKFNLFAGPQGSYNITHKYKYEEEELGLPGYEEEGDIEDYFLGLAEVTKFDYGAVFGAGIDFIIKGIQMSVDARYDLCFAPILDITGISDFDLKNGTIAVMVGVGF